LGLALAEETIISESRDHGQTEAEGLSRPSKVSHNQVFFIVDFPERAVLNWEKFIDATSTQPTDRDLVDFREIAEVA